MAMIIYNRWLPFRGFTAINLFGIILVRRGLKMNAQLLNHEQIHTRQQIEMLFLPFYLWYVAEWLVRLVQCRNRLKAYELISFEQEAYRNQRDLSYLRHRRPYAWINYISSMK